jgi:hypothetical protein
LCFTKLCGKNKIESGGKEESKGRSVEILISKRRKAETKEERMTYKQEY